MRSRRTLFDLLICLSLFNLLLLRIWAQLLPAVVNPANLYYMEAAPNRLNYPLVLLSLFGASAIACAAAQWARRSRSSWPATLARAGLITLAALALNSVSSQIPESGIDGLVGTPGSGQRLVLGALAAAAFVGLLWFRSGWLIGAIEVFAIVAAPFLLMTVGQSAYAWATYRSDAFKGQALAAGPLAPRLPTSAPAAPRLVWIVFDELDQRALFTARPPGLALGEFDRLRAGSFIAVNAYAPARDTRRSIASLLLGRQVAAAMPSGASELPCTSTEQGREVVADDCWTAYPNLLGRLRETGVNVGVSGWYHPYCRLFADVVSECTWAGLPYWNSGSVFDAFDQQWHEVMKTLPIARDWLRPGRRIRSAHREAYERIAAGAIGIAADPGIGFALLHFPVPHHPDIYDPILGRLSVTDRRSYFDNLVLADRTLGDVRAAMESAGLWDTSIVVVTSDHWWRAIHRGDWGLLPEEEAVWANERDRRIPVLVKFAQQHEPTVYRRAFNTRLLHEVALEMRAGRIDDPAALVDWLDEWRSRAPVPYLSADPSAP